MFASLIDVTNELLNKVPAQLFTHPAVNVAVWTVIKFALFVLVFVMGTATVLTWLERKYSAVIQNRIGPNRANLGKWRLGGLLHMLADPL